MLRRVRALPGHLRQRWRAVPALPGRPGHDRRVHAGARPAHARAAGQHLRRRPGVQGGQRPGRGDGSPQRGAAHPGCHPGPGQRRARVAHHRCGGGRDGRAWCPGRALRGPRARLRAGRPERDPGARHEPHLGDQRPGADARHRLGQPAPGLDLHHDALHRRSRGPGVRGRGAAGGPRGRALRAVPAVPAGHRAGDAVAGAQRDRRRRAAHHPRAGRAWRRWSRS